jgi:uncharacterized membrane protein YtjA (UPF0391 family)
MARRSDARLGGHGVPEGPWRTRPRDPFRLDGFTLRFVVIPLVFAVIAVVLGVSALASGRATGAVQIIIGLLLVALATAYFRRPVKK